MGGGAACPSRRTARPGPGPAEITDWQHSKAAQVLKDCLCPVGGETEGGSKAWACQGPCVPELRGPSLPGSRRLHPLLCPHAMRL